LFLSLPKTRAPRWRKSRNNSPADVPVHKTHAVPPGVDAYVPFGEKIAADSSAPVRSQRRWHSIAWLESLGLLPEFADQLEKKVRTTHGDEPPPMPIAEWTAVRDVLAGFWHPARQIMEGTGRPHVFVGPPGSGKTTVLCKWMTVAVLTQEYSVRVWRLDGSTANTSEFLSLHSEMLGLQAERFWTTPDIQADLVFVDLPGVESHDAHACGALREQLAALPQPHMHLVLNAACESSILFEQIHAFAPLAPEDVIFTHLDEERHRVKLWNFVLGTNLPLSFLSAGQKIPGEFCRAESALLFPCEKRRK
jgi:flagellar biosynthesis protein FlhF